MARYEHLPIFKEAYDLAVHIEKIVRISAGTTSIPRYGFAKQQPKDTRENCRRQQLPKDRVSACWNYDRNWRALRCCPGLCHDSGGFASTRSYLHVAERITGIARQNEGWIKKSEGREIIKGLNRMKNQKL